MTRILRALVALVLLSALPTQAERNLVRPPGTTRYAPMVARLKALLAYDQTQGAHRMTLTRIGQSVKGRDIWQVMLHEAPPAEADPQPPAPSTEDTGGGETDNATLHPLPSEERAEGGEGGEPQASRVRAVPDNSAGTTPPKSLLYLCRQHGHEPASTEGALAFIDKLVRAQADSPLARDLQRVTVYVIPMANPDGAEAFLRHNAYDVDLNRDWLRQTQPETRAWLRAIKQIHPDLMTDQHELYPDDRRWDFTETAGIGSGAASGLVETCETTQAIVQGAMQAEGFPTVRHLINDRHPARLAHRYGCVALGIPTILFETNRLTWMQRSVASRAAAHEQFMTDVLRDLAGEQSQMEAEANVWQMAHARNALLASRKKIYRRNSPPRPNNGEPEEPSSLSGSPLLGRGGVLGAGGRSSGPEKTSE